MRVLVVACVILAACAIDIKNNAFTNKEQQVLVELQNSKWAQFILNYAELHLKTSGILQELQDGIQELIGDLEEELQAITAAFARRTDQHNRDVIRLEQEIQDADREIFNGNDMIDNVLFPMKRRLTNALRQLNENIESNRKNLDEETLIREKEREIFEARVAEHNEAIEAIDECLALLASLTNPSFAQIKKIQSNISKVEKSLSNHSNFTPLVRALLELATDQNFADQGAIGQIVTAFNELRVEIVNSLNQETADENERQAEFEERVDQLNSEHAEFQRQVLLRNAELTATEEKTVATQEFVDQRKQDKNTLEAQLDAENNAYVQETEIFENLKAQYLRELEASEKALALLSQPSFEEYVKNTVGF